MSDPPSPIDFDVYEVQVQSVETQFPLQSEDDEDIHVCGRCREHFSHVDSFVHHNIKVKKSNQPCEQYQRSLPCQVSETEKTSILDSLGLVSSKGSIGQKQSINQVSHKKDIGHAECDTELRSELVSVDNGSYSRTVSLQVRSVASRVPGTSSGDDDIHVCGICQSVLFDADLFVKHKRRCVGKKSVSSPTKRRQGNASMQNSARQESQSRHLQSFSEPDCIVDLDGAEEEMNVITLTSDPSYPSVRTERRVSRRGRKWTKNKWYIRLGKSTKGNKRKGKQKATRKTNGMIEKRKTLDDLKQKGKLHAALANTFSTSYSKKRSKYIRKIADASPVLCELCGRCLRSSSSLQVHMRIHEGEKKFLCSYCSFATVDNDKLEEHITFHESEMLIKTEDEDYNIGDTSTTEIHVQIHAAPPESYGYFDEYTNKRTKKGKSVKHAVGDAVLISEEVQPEHTKQSRHEKSHPSSSAPSTSMVTGVAPEVSMKPKVEILRKAPAETALVDYVIVCGMCEYTCSTHSALRNHLKEHWDEKTFDFTRCASAEQPTDENPQKNEGVDGRPRKQHPYKFKCSFCGNEFIREGTCKRHVQRHRDKAAALDVEKPLKKRRKKDDSVVSQKFQCPYCDLKFAHEGFLRNHLRKHQNKDSGTSIFLKNNKEEPAIQLESHTYVCAICATTFPNEASFQNHLQKHQGEDVTVSNEPSMLVVTEVPCETNEENGTAAEYVVPEATGGETLPNSFIITIDGIQTTEVKIEDEPKSNLECVQEEVVCDSVTENSEAVPQAKDDVPSWLAQVQEESGEQPVILYVQDGNSNEGNVAAEILASLNRATPPACPTPCRLEVGQTLRITRQGTES